MVTDQPDMAGPPGAASGRDVARAVRAPAPEPEELPGATAGLAARAAALRLADIPDDVVTVAKQCVLDLFGVAIAGSAEPGPRMVRAAVLGDSAAGRSSLFGAPAARTSASAAALVNGTAAHALDFDDVLTPMTGHPSAPVLPAAFAVAEERGLSGARLLEAFISGVETECRIGTAVAPGHYGRGFHATGTVGTFGAAAAVARLLDAGTTAMEMALGVAASQAAGLKAQFGTMTKPLHAGSAAAGGLLAARLAVQGFTSAPDIITCAQGFAATQADCVDRRVLSAPFGAPWHMLRTLFKMHASCHYTHSAFEAVRSLRDRVAVDDVSRVVLRVHPDLLAACGIPEPRTGLEAKFSLRFVAALALARGNAGPGQLTDEVARAPELCAVRDRVEVAPSARVPHFTCECLVETADGSSYTASHDSEKPAWRHSPAEQSPPLLEKFAALTKPALGSRPSSDLASAIMRLEEVTDVSALLAPDGAA